MSNLKNFTITIRKAYNLQLAKIIHDVHSDEDNQALAELVISPTSEFEELAIVQSNAAAEYSAAFEVLGAKKAYKTLDVKYKETKKNKLVQDYVSKHGFKMCKSLTDDVRQEASNILHEGVREGYSPYTIAKKIRDIPNNALNELPAPKFRADMIARTESAMALNKGMDETMKSYGVTHANWITAGDHLVCEYCEELENDNPHRIGELPLVMHPNCRCTRTYEVPDKISYNADVDTLSTHEQLS